uniref:G-protein coupled receptors family 1 profile domain-containing protein n=1 Tax=Plectus sambesii TaxID=2011161 RepID=A0A914X5S8_9BILA
MTDGTDSTLEMDSRRSSAWSAIKMDGAAPTATASSALGTSKKMSTISRGKLRRIATQVTRAIRRKRRESLAIRRESRATRVVAAILIAFIICWLPYFCISVYRGICLGLNCQLNTHLHLHLFLVSSWFGYVHSCFNPVIYMCLNKNFRRTLQRLICCCAAT